MTVELRPYQNEAITAIFEGLAGGGWDSYTPRAGRARV